MFQKTILSTALLAGFAAVSFSAQAADVQLYGTVDYGFIYNHAKTTETGADSVKDDSFSMASGTNSASAFGLTGSEDLGNGLKVTFRLENGIEADSGSLSTEGTIFDREASLAVSGGFGSVYFGRMGAVVGDTGSVGFYGAQASALGTGWGDNITGHSAVFANFEDVRDNTVTYVSPEFAGGFVYAQYAFGENGKELKSGTDRYAAIGAQWQVGPVGIGALVDWTNKDASKLDATDTASVDDAFTYNLSGSYDFGVAQAFLAVQYFQDVADAAGIIGDFGKERQATKYDTMTGWGVHVGTAFAALGGDFKVGVGYMDAQIDHEGKDSGLDAKAWTASVGYEYGLSERTTLYCGAGYRDRKVDGVRSDGNYKLQQKSFDVAAGLVHNF